ncbi:MAG: glutamine amidotransferase [Pseudomonadota bacterium]
MARIVLIRHSDEPEDDRVVTFFRRQGATIDTIKPFKGEALGEVDGSVAASVVYGGPFNTYEEDKHPFLREENRWIEQCLKHNVPILGICQGAQSMARVLGAYTGPKRGAPCEFGYYEIFPTEAGRAYFPERMVVTQSHFHEFHVPQGAEHLASSETFSYQAFKYGACAYAFQFHAEVTPAGFRRWQQSDRAIQAMPGAQTHAQQDVLMSQHDAAQGAWFMEFMQSHFQAAAEAAAPQASGASIQL